MKALGQRDMEHVLEHTRSAWEGVRGARLFLTGATGFFGAWLVESFAHANRELKLCARAVVLSRDPEAFLRRMPHLRDEAALEFVAGDVERFEAPAGGFDYVLHGATPTNMEAAKRPAELQRMMIRGCDRVAELAEERGARGFLLVSSGAVYGQQPEGMERIPESYKGGPDWLDADAVYAESKRVCERRTALLARAGVRCAIARCFAFVGPHLPLDTHFAIGNFIRDAMEGRPIVVKGDGTPVRSYLYAADLAAWLWTLLLRAEELDENPAVFNVGAGERVSVRELAECVARVVRPGLEVRVLGQSALDAKRVQYVPDVTKAERELGLRAWVGLEEAVRRTVEWGRLRRD
ncbi:MAG TPA: NAD-dependent epimerase/dehydratase family protein [Terracidiphilus sp.]|nr:NAD-dependent epimerase/dehydratase family protein [Terracidiphilus sp.]